MKITKKLISALMVLVILFSLFSVNVYAKTTKKVTLTVSAAASLTDAMTEIAGLYKKEKSNITLEFNFGSSGSLQKQIEQGAPVDVFLSAATKQMDALKSGKLLIDDTIKTLLFNEVVLIVPRESDSSLTGFRGLTRKSVKTVALGDPASVPAGQYAEQVLTYYEILDKVKAKAVYAKDVTEVLTWVESGNADAGIVYKTDALGSDKVTIISTAPEASHKTVEYPAAVIKDSKHSKEAKEFLSYLSGSKATAIFKKYGFIVK